MRNFGFEWRSALRLRSEFVTLLISQKLGIASTSTYNAKNAEKSKNHKLSVQAFQRCDRGHIQ
jgi:hypothetical protein